jgi:hypothetical protein
MDEMKIVSAFHSAQKRRPYAADDKLIRAATPAGGQWQCVAQFGDITRKVMWHDRAEVAIVNARGDLDDSTEGQIAMAIASLPTMDCALRAILVLAEDAANLDLIRRLAISVIAQVERPAPRIPEPAEENEAAEED